MAENITKNEAIINVLLEGGAMTAPEVAEKASAPPDITVSDAEATALLGKLIKTDLGYFIDRRKDGRRFVYEMVEEARALTPEQARWLSLKRGKDRYTLEQAVEEYPDLGPIVQAKQEEESLESELGAGEEGAEETAERTAETAETFETAETTGEEIGDVSEPEEPGPATMEEAGAAPDMPSMPMAGKGDLLAELVAVLRSGIKVNVTHDVRVRIRFE